MGNQATATYLDENNVERTVTSNLVVTTIQQIAGLDLGTGAARRTSAGGQAAFPHSVTNMGNGQDVFSLAAANVGGDDFDFTQIRIYADVNEDGVPDNTTPLTQTPALKPGETFSFVVIAQVSPGAGNNTSGNVSLTATSVYDAGSFESITSTATVTQNAVIALTKAINNNSGAAGSGPYTYTFTFANSGNLTATDLEITDVLPAGVTYVANSGRFSGTGATALGDAAGSADDPVGAGITYEANTTVSVALASLAPGQSAQVSFQVTIDAGVAPGDIINTATYEYDDGSGSVVTAQQSNAVRFTVLDDVAVSMVGATVPSASQGGTVSFTNVVTNDGNGPDRFDIVIGANTFPAGTTFTLYKNDGLTPLMDTNGNGIPDTGVVASGASYNVILRVSLPNNVAGSTGYTVAKTAISINDPSITATVVDTLSQIVGSTMDVMNNLDDPTAPGFGPGPEALSVLSTPVNPGSTTRVTLYLKNTSSISDNYRLRVSTDGTFAAETLPAGWTVSFVNAAGARISATEVLAAGISQVVYADVTVPAGTAAGETSLYFQAYSPNTGASDTLHNSILVNAARMLSINPKNEGKVYAGGSVVYAHLLRNEGNVMEGDGVVSSISLSSSDSMGEFTSVVYYDANDDGMLGSGDPVVENLDAVGPLNPGDTVRLFVKVFAQIGVAQGASNATTLTVQTVNGSYTTTVPALVATTDLTKVVSDQIVLVKRQALDVDLDGVPDAPYSTSPITTGATPGVNVLYQIVVTNLGTENANSVEVFDATPSFTTYTTSAAAATDRGSVSSTPADGAAGTLVFAIGTLQPSQTATVTFGVRIE